MVSILFIFRKKALMGEFLDYEIRTVGDLAKLTEDRLDRLSLKPPKRTNVFSVLEVCISYDINFYLCIGFVLVEICNKFAFSHVGLQKSARLPEG